MSEVSLKEYFEASISALEQRFCLKIRALEIRLKEQHDSDEKALLLKAADMEKNTDDTKDEIGRLSSLLLTKVSREEWSDYHARNLTADYVKRTEFLAHNEATRVERAEALGAVRGQAKITALIYSVIGIAIAIASVIIGFIYHR